MISYKGKEYVEYDNAIALLEEKDKEIERLNNIINEIEKYCDELIIYKAVVTKIRELKGDDK